MTRHGSHTESRMRENCTYGSMRGRAYPITRGVPLYSTPFYIMNVGKRKGSELVQLYVRDEVAKIARPRRELKGFKRVELGSGETKRVEIKVPVESLGYFVNGRYVVEPGRITVWLAPDSDSGKDICFELK